MKQSEQLDKLAPALAKAQSEMGGAVKDSSNPFFKSKYADLTSVWKACKESLHNNGFSVIQSPINEDGRVGVATMLLHSSGQFVSDKYTLGVKKDNDPQADGSSITYARRYALAAFVGVCPVDDDGEAAMMRKSKPTKLSPQAAGWIETGSKEIENGQSFKAYWAEHGVEIKKACGEAQAKAIHATLSKVQENHT